MAGMLSWSVGWDCLVWPAWATISWPELPERAATSTATRGLVRINVSVWDAQGQPIPDLAQGDFTILEQGQPQHITHFIKATAPLRVMVLVDMSESMIRVWPRLRDAVMHWVSFLGPHDEVAVVSFAREPRLETDFSANVERIKKILAGLQVVREQHEVTQLYDALPSALDHLVDATNNMRNGLLLVTDGFDHGSQRVSQKESLRLASERFVTVYVIQAPGRDRDYLKTLAMVTAGRLLRADQFLERHLEELAQHLRFHYVLGYVPSQARPANKPVGLQVKVSRPGVKIIAPEVYQTPPSG